MFDRKSQADLTGYLMLTLVCMHTEHHLKASEINGRTSVDFRGCKADVGEETSREMTQGAATS